MNQFVILAPARSGSSLLASALSAHPSISMHGEIFHLNGLFWQGAHRSPTSSGSQLMDGATFLRRYIYHRDNSDATSSSSAIGFKLLYGQAHSALEEPAWNYLAKDRSIRVIHLRRSNLLESYISLRIALITGEWFIPHNAKVERETPRLYLEPGDTARYFASIKQHEIRIMSSFRSHPLLAIEYDEHLKSGFAQTLTRVQAFLGVSYQRLTGQTAKQAQLSPAAIVANYSALCHYFRRSEYACFFE